MCRQAEPTNEESTFLWSHDVRLVERMEEKGRREAGWEGGVVEEPWTADADMRDAVFRSSTINGVILLFFSY